MTMWLKQSTAATIKFGPFVDSTDGASAETGLTIAQANIRLSKNGGDAAQTHNAAGAAHDENGYYNVPLDTTDTGTLGTLSVFTSMSGALPVWQNFMVVPANVWDSLFASDRLAVDVEEIGAGIITAAAIATGAIDADALAADAVDEILDEVVEGTLMLRQVMRLMLSVFCGKASGGGTTTIAYRDLADGKPRVTLTVDSVGDRSASVVDGT